MSTQENIVSREVSCSEADFLFLYDILKQRGRFEKDFELPGFQSHCEFVKHNTYRSFHIYSWSDIDLGVVFISQDNEIGIYLLSSNIRKYVKRCKTRTGNLATFMTYESIKSLQFPESLLFRAVEGNVRAIGATGELMDYGNMSEMYNVRRFCEGGYCKHVLTRR